MPNDSAGRRVATGLALAATLALAGCDDSTGPSTPPPSITTSSLADGVMGEPYSEAINATDGDGEYSWSVSSGSLPPGLELSVADLGSSGALITGTPEAAGNFSFGIRVVDGAGRADTANLSISIREPPGELAITTLRLPPTLAQWPFGVHLQASGGDGENYEWSVAEGLLPQGLQLTDEGRFQGTPAASGTSTFAVEVSSGGFTARRTFTLTVVEERTDRYAITAFPVKEVPPALQTNLDEAIRRWEGAITGDLPSGTLPAGDSAFFDPEDCEGFGNLVNGTAIDDIIVMVNIDSIDGAGRVLGQARPCGIRTDNTPFIGILILDEDDLLGMTNEEQVTHLIQHEIAHILGFGALWNLFDLLVGTTDTVANNPRYVGEAAVAAYRAVVDTATAVPVENTGGQGTSNSHWREEVFDNELMTGFLDRTNFLSEMTIASFEDLGYQVDRSAADSNPLLGLVDGSLYDVDSDGIELHHDIPDIGPIVVWHPDGTHTILPDLDGGIP